MTAPKDIFPKDGISRLLDDAPRHIGGEFSFHEILLSLQIMPEAVLLF